MWVRTECLIMWVSTEFLMRVSTEYHGKAKSGGIVDSTMLLFLAYVTECKKPCLERGFEYLGEEGRSTWERGVEVTRRGGLVP